MDFGKVLARLHSFMPALLSHEAKTVKHLRTICKALLSTTPYKKKA